jgi:hypothetical protein
MSNHDEPTGSRSDPMTGGSDAAHATGAPPAGAAEHRSRLDRAQHAVLWSSVTVLVLVGLFFVTDAVLRQVVQNVVRTQIQSALPPDVTAKDLSVKVDGFSVIQQLIAGRFQKMELTSPDVRVQGNPLKASVVAHGVPIDTMKPVQSVQGTVVIGQDAVNGLVSLPNQTTVTLNRDAVGLKGTGQILGIDVGYTASVSPTLQNGDTVVLTPLKVKVTAGGGAFDVTRFAKDLVPSQIPICVAQYLPKGVKATGLDIHERSATVSVAADGLVLGGDALQKRGSCG